MNILKIIVFILIINNCCFSMINNHNNKYEPNTIYTSTQYLIDTNPDLIKSEKNIMQLNQNLCNPKSQSSYVFGLSVNQQISKKMRGKQLLSINDFRNIIDSFIKGNINDLPEQAMEVKNFNKVLTKFTLNTLLNKVIGNNINIKEHKLLLLNNSNINSIFGDKYNNDIKELGIIKYKNKQCLFKVTNRCNKLYYTVFLQ